MNRVYLDNVQKKGDKGFNFYDEYINVTQFIGETPTDDLELLHMVVDHCTPEASDLIDFCIEEERGIEINDTFYEYEEIKHILTKNKG